MSGTEDVCADAPPDEVRVLVADDSPTNVFVLTAMLRSLGLTTVTAADGAEAVEIAAERCPALIFMDVHMPRMDGMAAAQQIRRTLRGRRVAIVAVTAYPDARHLPDFKAADFDDFLVKPVELSVVRRAVEKWMTWSGGDGRSGAAPA
jgi:CheY-like chemotaxis protein